MGDVSERRATVREVGPITIEIVAPAGLVYQMLSAIGQGAQRPGARADVIETTSQVCAGRVSLAR